MTFLIVLPWMNGFTFSEFFAGSFQIRCERLLDWRMTSAQLAGSL